eukprot:3880232-Pleurochrysis_carterae.AAC.1
MEEGCWQGKGDQPREGGWRAKSGSALEAAGGMGSGREASGERPVVRKVLRLSELYVLDFALFCSSSPTRCLLSFWID